MMILAIAGFIGVFGVYVLTSGRKIRSDDLLEFNIEKLTNKNALRLSGSITHSSYAIKSITFSKKDAAVDIDLVMVFAGMAPSGDFEFVVFCGHAKEIRIGTDRKVVWKTQNP